MLIVKRLPGETIHILPSPDLDPEMRVSDLFKDEGIEIHLFNSQRSYASIGIEAPECPSAFNAFINRVSTNIIIHVYLK